MYMCMWELNRIEFLYGRYWVRGDAVNDEHIHILSFISIIAVSETHLWSCTPDEIWDKRIQAFSSMSLLRLSRDTSVIWLRDYEECFSQTRLVLQTHKLGSWAEEPLKTPSFLQIEGMNFCWIIIRGLLSCSSETETFYYGFEGTYEYISWILMGLFNDTMD